MLDAILFDLDDTLLQNDMAVFIPRYLELLAEHAAGRVDKGELVAAVIASTQAMMNSIDPSTTNREVFWEHFEGLTGFSADRDEQFFERFYFGRYRTLRGLTRRLEAARTLLDHCHARGYRIVIATNPVYPRRGILERLVWAGLEPLIDDCALITSYENMHATKPHPDYYREILNQLDCSPAAAVMVGNDTTADIEPARAAGLHTFHVDGRASPNSADRLRALEPPGPARGEAPGAATGDSEQRVDGRGALADVGAWLDRLE